MSSWFKTQSELYIDVMRLKLRHFVLVHENGLVIQPSLFWLAASPDGLIAYQTSDKKLLLEIKYPHTKRNMSPTDLVQDPFFLKLEKGKPFLKKSHSTGYFKNTASNGTFRFW